MTGIDTLGVTASAMGTALAIAPVLQMRLIVRSGTSRGVSLGYALVLAVAMTLWLAYGVAISAPAIIVPNLVSVLVSTALIVTIWRYRERTTGSQRAVLTSTPGISPETTATVPLDRQAAA